MVDDRVNPATPGKIGETVCSMDTSSPTPEPIEYERRKPAASGTIVKLGDGQPWLLANPSYSPRLKGLTQPLIDRALDRLFESSVLDGNLALSDVAEVGRALLKENYELSENEVTRLLTVSPGPECRALASAVLDAMFGSDQTEKSFSAWVRATLLANGLCGIEIPAKDLLNVLAVLLTTNRTIPLSKFAEACRLLDERSQLETLI
jgi:hypothetical protein